MSTAMAARRSGEALSLFRSLLRTQRKCFKGDTDMLAAVAKQIRSEFDIHKNVEDADELDKLLLKAREGVEYMQVNIVQAKLNERGNYGEFSVSQSFQPMGMLDVFCTTCMCVSRLVSKKHHHQYLLIITYYLRRGGRDLKGTKELWILNAGS